jgi:pimeloyl-ACP methyl ester carboxylesterase
MSAEPVVHADFARERSRLRFYDVISGDGTRIRAWDNGVEGPTVLLCNGLGTNPYSWPALLEPDCGVHVISWQHRGTGGSERPRKRSAAGIEEFVQDAVAVLDDAGLDRVPVIGWSMGVNTAFELATLHPERVSGLFAVAGVPGRTFGTMLRPLHLPRVVNEAITVSAARLMSLAGPLLSPVAARLPMGPIGVGIVSHSGFMLPVADVDDAGRTMREFLTTPLDWYFHMALQTHRHARVSLSAIDVPAMFVAGRWDVLAGARDMLTAAARMRDASYVELQASHFLPLEKPDQLHALLLEFLERLDAA